MSEINSEFVQSVQQLLEEGKVSEFLAQLNDPKHNSEIENGSWSLIPLLTKYLTSQHEENNFRVFKCCESGINILAEKSNPEEALLQFIEEVEECNEDCKFLTLLKPLKILLFRIPSNQVNSFAWCFNAIQTFLNKCEIPDDSNDVKRVLSVYTELLRFYDESCKAFEQIMDSHTKDLVCKFLIELLGKPLLYLDVDIIEGVINEGRVIVSYIMERIFIIGFNLISLIETQYEKESNELTKPTTLSISALFYSVYSEDEFFGHIPQVYNPVYIFQAGLYLVTDLLNLNNDIIVKKGLKLVFSLLKRVKHLKLSYYLLDSEAHCYFIKSLSRIIIYNQVGSLRKFALEVYKTYLTSFEIHGFYLLTYNVLSVVSHSGLKGFTISLYKDLLAKDFLSNEKNISVYFKSDKLLRILGKCCYLEQKEESDLIELFDQINASLNLLRYLALRDQQNTTGIWNYFSLLEETYFNPLKKGLELSKAHYELKIKEIEEDKAAGDKNKTNVKILGTEQLSAIPTSEKLKVLNSSLTAFDLLDCLLSRLMECIKSKIS